jgi:acetyltransferase-like isoleucine patch superfamily enzyme
MNAFIDFVRKVLSFLKLQNYRNPETIYEKYKIGKGTYGAPTVLEWSEGTTLQIGAFCSIAKEVTIFLGGDHRVDWVTTYPFNCLWKAAENITGHPRTKGDVFIGNDVWIGYGAVIMSGVKIDNGAVIGTRAVVTQNVPPYAIVAGNPAKIVKMRFDDKTIQRLEQVKWWKWDDAKIEQNLPLLLQTDIEVFLRIAENKPQQSS